MFLGLGGQPSSCGAPGLGSRVNALSAPRLGGLFIKRSVFRPFPGTRGGQLEVGCGNRLCWALACLGPPGSVTLGVSPGDVGRPCHVTLAGHFPTLGWTAVLVSAVKGRAWPRADPPEGAVEPSTRRRGKGGAGPQARGAAHWASSWCFPNGRG